MGFRLWERKSLGKFASVNISKSGPSISVGPRGGRVSVSKRGTRKTVGIPGTGVSYISYPKKGKKKQQSRQKAQQAAKPQRSLPIKLGFFEKLFMPEEEVAFVEGVNAMSKGQKAEALANFHKAASIPDSYFCAALYLFQEKEYEPAIRYFTRVLKKHAGLGKLLRKYGIRSYSQLTICHGLKFAVTLDLDRIKVVTGYGHLMAGDREKAARYFKNVLASQPQQVDILLACIYGIFATIKVDEEMCKKIVELTREVERQSEHHAAVLMYKARALRKLGLHTAARDELSSVIRKKSILTDRLELALRYERSLVYEAMGHMGRARKEWEKIYSQAPDFKDVEEKLDL